MGAVYEAAIAPGEQPANTWPSQHVAVDQQIHSPIQESAFWKTCCVSANGALLS